MNNSTQAITNIIHEMAKYLCKNNINIIVPNAIMNKDKKIFVGTVSFPLHLDGLQVKYILSSLQHKLEEELCDDSTIVLVLPNYIEGIDGVKVDIKTLDTETIDPKRLENLIESAKEIIEKIQKQ